MLPLDQLDFATRQKLFNDADAARAFLESVRWPDGPVCPHCGVEGDAYKLEPKPGAKRPVRPGAYHCRTCRKQFTVTVGTVFESSRLPLNKWLYAIHLMCSSKKGISANQLARDLGCQYKTAWFLCHRVRKAMEADPMRERLSGVVEADQTYVGGKMKGAGGGGPTVHGQKAVVFVLVSRNGDSYAEHVTSESAASLQGVMRDLVKPDTAIMTDQHKSYTGLDAHFKSHERVDHSAGEYVRGVVHTNFAESWHSLLKRGIFGAFHHLSKKHLQRYLGEFDFRWNTRERKDWERVVALLGQVAGKRLYYRVPKEGLRQQLAS